MRALISICAVILLAQPVLAAAPDPPDDLETVKYVRTIDGGTIVVRNASGNELTVRLLAVTAPDLRGGTPEAFSAALWVSEQLAAAESLGLEYDDAWGIDEEGRLMAWLWYEKCCVPAPMLLLNTQVIANGHAALSEPDHDWRYADELVKAVKRAEQLAAEPADAGAEDTAGPPNPDMPVLDISIDEPATDKTGWAIKDYDIDDPGTYVAFRRTGESYTESIWLYEKMEVMNVSNFFVDWLEIEVRYYCSDGT